MVVSLFVRRYAPFKVFTGGFAGDDRDAASTSMTATAKTIAAVQFDLVGVRGYEGHSSGTTFVGLGAAVKKWIGTHHARVEVTVEDVKTTPHSIAFTMVSAGANPLTPGAPPIRTWIDFSATSTGTGMRYAAVVRGSPFPNGEVFIVDGDRDILLFDYHTKGTSVAGPFKLIGNYEHHVLGRFDAVFGAHEPSRRCAVTIEA